MTRWLLALLFAFGSVTFLTGCPAEDEPDAGDVIDDAKDKADDVKDDAEDVVDDIAE